MLQLRGLLEETETQEQPLVHLTRLMVVLKEVPVQSSPVQAPVLFFLLLLVVASDRSINTALGAPPGKVWETFLFKVEHKVVCVCVCVCVHRVLCVCRHTASETLQRVSSLQV